jgi:hypothetical protein
MQRLQEAARAGRRKIQPEREIWSHKNSDLWNQ